MPGQWLPDLILAIMLTLSIYKETYEQFFGNGNKPVQGLLMLAREHDQTQFSIDVLRILEIGT
jgi:hypothetical protein